MEEEDVVQDLKPQVEAQGEQRRLSFPPAQVALHRIRLFQGKLGASPALLTRRQADCRLSQRQVAQESLRA